MYTMLGKTKYLIFGLIIGVLLSGGIVYAASDYVLTLFEARLIFNGIEKKGSDAAYQYYNGQTYVPVSLNYQGTTYVPLRFFSEAIGLPVKYVEVPKTIYVGNVPPDDEITQYMSDVLKPYFISGGNYSLNPAMNVAGKAYKTGYQVNHYYYSSDYCTLSFNLEGKYKNIGGTVGLDDIGNTNDGELHFYGDENLIASFELKAGSLPQAMELNVEGIKKLDIKYKANYSPLDLVEVTIK